MLLKKHLPTNKEINAVVLKKYSEQKNGYNVVYEDANIKNEALDITIETRNPNRKEAKKRVSDLQKGGFNFG